MNNLIFKLYPIMKDKALQSNMSNQLSAVIIIKKKIITKPCCNINRNYCRGNVCGSIHAEANALLNYYGRKLQFDKYKNRWYLLYHKEKKINIFVIRVIKNNIMGNARPCKNCLDMMKDLNVNKVYYSTGIGDEIICESIKNMISIQISKYLIIKKLNYFENLFKKIFPPKIKQENLLYFINYNFKNVLPECSYIIKNKIIIFYDKNKKILLESIII